MKFKLTVLLAACVVTMGLLLGTSAAQAATVIFDPSDPERAIGINNLDVGHASGFLQFSDEPEIDFATIIKLIQTHPDEYRLDGQEKLRFYGDFEEPETRIAKVESVLSKIAGK